MSFMQRRQGRFANVLFEAKANDLIKIPDRLIIPNDSKIFAQGSVEKDIRYFVTADVKSKKVIETLRIKCAADIEHLDINTSHATHFGLFDFGPVK